MPISAPGNLPFVLQDRSKLFCSASPTSSLSHLPCCDTIVHISILLMMSPAGTDL